MTTGIDQRSIVLDLQFILDAYILYCILSLPIHNNLYIGIVFTVLNVQVEMVKVTFVDVSYSL